MLDAVEPTPQPVVRTPGTLEEAGEVAELQAGELLGGRDRDVAQRVADPGTRKDELERERDLQLVDRERVLDDLEVQELLDTGRTGAVVGSMALVRDCDPAIEQAEQRLDLLPRRSHSVRVVGLPGELERIRFAVGVPYRFELGPERSDQELLGGACSPDEIACGFPRIIELGAVITAVLARLLGAGPLGVS